MSIELKAGRLYKKTIGDKILLCLFNSDIKTTIANYILLVSDKTYKDDQNRDCFLFITEKGVLVWEYVSWSQNHLTEIK